MSRTENSLRNIKFALVGQAVGIAVSFVSRIVFVRVLSAEYLGVNGLFANILTMLSVAELGIGSAITFSLYAPLASRDEPRLRALMRVYRKAYSVIGCVVGVVGTALTPFLPFLVKEMPAVPHLGLIYLLFVANSAITYFFSYKRAFLIADQKRYIATLYRYSFFVALNLVQMAILVATANYVAFLAAQVVFTLAENLAVSRAVNRMYPFLRASPTPPLSVHDRATLVRNIKAMVYHRLGGVVLGGTDSIVIAKFAGVVAVGLYSNYLLITGALSVVLGILFSSITASVGNLGVEGDSKKQLETFWAIDLATFWVYSFASTSLFVLFNPFIDLWLGGGYLFDWPVVLAIAFNFYITGVRSSLWVFKDAKGIFWPDRYRPVVEVVVNLGASILLAQEFGVLGVLLGTIVSTLLVCLPIEPLVVFKYGFDMGPRRYYGRYALHMLTAVLCGALTWGVAGLIPIGGWVGFLAKGIVCLVIPNGICLILFGRNREFKRLLEVVGRR